MTQLFIIYFDGSPNLEAIKKFLECELDFKVLSRDNSGIKAIIMNIPKQCLAAITINDVVNKLECLIPMSFGGFRIDTNEFLDDKKINACLTV